MHEQPKISIIVPCYNVEKYLDVCVKSIIAQTYRNLEIILVDDGSPDNCPQMCDDWAKKDPRINVIHQKNGGLSAARNAGMTIATGDFIGFVDSDDSIEPDMYEQMLRSLLCEPKAELAICGVQTIVEGSKDEVTVEEYDKYFAVKEAQTVSVNTSWANSLPATAWNKLYRRDFLMGNGIRFPQGMNNEDEAFFLFCMARAKHIAFVPARLYHYYRRGCGIIVEQQEKFASIGTLPDFILKIAPLLIDFIMRDRRYDLLGRVMLNLLAQVDKLKTDIVKSWASALINKLDIDLRLYADVMEISTDVTEALLMLSSCPYDEGLLKDSDVSLLPYPLHLQTPPPQISIIVPVYNVEQYLPRCMDSLIRQTYKNIEIIAVNDGSTDESLAILEEYASQDERVCVINQENRGTHIARLEGIRVSRGEYVLFVDSDDWIEESTCEILLLQINKTRDDILLFGTKIENEGGLTSKEADDIQKWFNKPVGHLTGSTEMLRSCFIEQGFSWNLCERLVKREAITKAFSELPQERCVFAEDELAMFYLFAYCQSLSQLPTLLYHYRYGVGISTKKNITIADYRRIMEGYGIISYFSNFAKEHYDDTPFIRQVLDEIKRGLIDHILELSPYRQSEREKEGILRTLQKKRRRYLKIIRGFIVLCSVLLCIVVVLAYLIIQ